MLTVGLIALSLFNCLQICLNNSRNSSSNHELHDCTLTAYCLAS